MAGQIHKGVTITFRDKSTGEKHETLIMSHLVADYWQTRLLTGPRAGHLQDVRESQILSVKEPDRAGKKIREVQGELF